MEVKFTDPTINRPEGDRAIDAPFIIANLEKYTKQLKEEDAWRKNDRNAITVYKTEGLTIVLTCLHKNADIKDNSLDGLLTIQVLDGTIDFTVKSDIQTLKKNQLVTIHPGLEHSILAKEDTVLLLTTSNLN